MAKTELSFYAFNRGLISKLALARVDLKRMAFSCEHMVNWMPRRLGSMMLRAGLKYTGGRLANLASRSIPFVFSSSDNAELEFTNQIMRVWVNDVVISRPAITATVTNGDFTTNLASWTDNDEAGAVSQWAVGGFMELLGTGINAAIRTQQTTIGVADGAKEHALTIVVYRGPATLRVGSTNGADDLISETSLATGYHSLAFTAGAGGSSAWIQFSSRSERTVYVNSCNYAGAGDMLIMSPYTTADLDYIRAGAESQSADVVFVACRDYSPFRVERRSTRSWSIVQYLPVNGPFRVPNTGPITLSASALSGDIIITASAPLFYQAQCQGNVNPGALFSITSTGQTVSDTFAALNDATNSIRVTGVGTDRSMTINLFGFTGGGRTIVLQRSFDDSTWVNVSGKSWTADTTESYADGLDNQIVYYRLLLSVVGTAGSTLAQMSIATGSITGIVRLLIFGSSTVVSAEVITDLGSAAATTDWKEGKWSDYRGWPTACSFYESRLCFGGLDSVDCTETDAFDSFATEFSDGESIGDSGAISRTLGQGTVDTVNWMLPLQRLVLGGDNAEYSVRSSSLDEPLTPTNFNVKQPGDQGSYPVQAVKVDSSGMMVQRGGTRVFKLVFDNETYDYSPVDITTLVPEIGRGMDAAASSTAHIVRMARQRQPDTRLHCVRSDGTAAVLVYDQAENVLCWLELTCAAFASGLIEDVVVLPGTTGSQEDQVYYTVKYTINGGTVRYRLKWALETECVGGTLNLQMDAFITGTNGPASAIITGLPHLEGATVICWADGSCDLDASDNPVTYVVTGGSITLTRTVTSWAVGGAYTAAWNSVKLGQSLSHDKRLDQIGFILKDTHARGLKYGADASHLDTLSLMVDSAPVTANTVHAEYDQGLFAFPGGYGPDERLYLQAQAPLPVTILAAITPAEVHH